MKTDKKFFWCINYKITAMPPATRTWYFNDQPLNLSDKILDLESAWTAKDLYVDEGKIFFNLLNPLNNFIYSTF